MSVPADRAHRAERCEDPGCEDPEELERLLRTALEEIDRYEQQLPHLVICADPTLGDATFSGPFASFAQAQRVADYECRSAGPASQMTFHVAPLYPALQLPRAVAEPVRERAVAVLGSGSGRPRPGPDDTRT